MMSIRSLTIFAVFFLVGAIATIGLRAALHRPYAETTTAHPMVPAAAMPTPPPPAGGHEGHDKPPAAPMAPAPAPKAEAPAHALPPAAHGSAVVIGNTICPGCGMDVDPALAPVATVHGVIAIACPPCVAKIRRNPQRYAEAARENREAP